jgi:hypothetical protein
MDLSATQPQKLTPELAQGANLLVTMGCGDESPLFQVSSATTGRSPMRKVKESIRCDRFAMKLKGACCFSSIQIS